MRRERKYIHTILADGAAMDETTGTYTNEQTLLSILVHVSSAPTTSENLIVTLDSHEGPEYDTIIYQKDLATVTDIAYTGIDLSLFVGDAIRVQYANTDLRTVSVRMALED